MISSQSMGGQAYINFTSQITTLCLGLVYSTELWCST